MGKSDDSITRRKNKRSRKKAESKRDSSSSAVSARVAAIIASKKRRLSGKRRQCQGMCFSLPTPENPFNEKQDKTEPSKKRKRDSKVKKIPMKVTKTENKENVKSAMVKSRTSFMGPEIGVNVGKPTCQIIKWDVSNNSWQENHYEKTKDCPSKFLIMCVKSIQDALQGTGEFSTVVDKPLFGNAWGLEFWNCYTNGKDVLEINEADSNMEQIAWVASTAADTISLKEKKGLSYTGPFLLYLVPSQDKAYKVRQVCKPLKALGVHTVSLHSGASIDHQILGLRSCEPELVVSTPERLLELLSLKSIDISEVSLLVMDGLEAPFKGTYFDAVKSIRQFITGKPRTVVFCDCINNSSISVVQKLLGESVCK